MSFDTDATRTGSSTVTRRPLARSAMPAAPLRFMPAGPKLAQA
jgi:hypothetical protein